MLRPVADMDVVESGRYPELGRTLCETIDACGLTGEPQSFACWTEGEPAHRVDVKAVMIAPGDIVVLIHDSMDSDVAVPFERDPALERSLPGIHGSYALTSRQLDVLQLIAAGATDKEVAVRLGISTFTASKHVANILSKMQVSCRTEASVRAVQAGLLKRE